MEIFVWRNRFKIWSEKMCGFATLTKSSSKKIQSETEDMLGDRSGEVFGVVREGPVTWPRWSLGILLQSTLPNLLVLSAPRIVLILWGSAPRHITYGQNRNCLIFESSCASRQKCRLCYFNNIVHRAIWQSLCLVSKKLAALILFVALLTHNIKIPYIPNFRSIHR